MSEKSRIIQELGNEELLLPPLIAGALQANDRIKYYFTLIQAAKARADNPDSQYSNLQLERQAARVEDGSLDHVIERSSRAGAGCSIPKVGEIYENIRKDIDTMIAPLKDAASYRSRLDRLLDQTPAIENDLVSGDFVAKLTSAQRDGADSLHLLVMDLHRQLNQLQASIYKDSIDGAHAYGISKPEDRAVVKAFMEGVNRTSPLKFDHPGLGTTATMSDGSISIQNDIGQTDAHVLVINVNDLSATVTCTDVHMERLEFFKSLFEHFGIEWSDTVSKKSSEMEDGGYLLAVGKYRARDRANLEEYLSFLGSRLVFLIDWNKARKRLRRFVKNGDAVSVLRWAADNEVGHMAFLKLSGDSLIVDAIERTPKAQLRYGETLADVLGRDSASEFLKFVLRASADVMLGGRSERFIRDEIRAELGLHFHGIYESLLGVCRDHAELVVELGAAALGIALQFKVKNAGWDAGKALRRAADWEKRADDLLNKARHAIKRTGAPEAVERIMEHADDAADSLEEAVFLFTLMQNAEVSFSEPLIEIAELASRAAMEYLKAVECARLVRTSGKDEIEDFLAAVDSTGAIEHAQDDAYRKAKAAIVNGAQDFRQLHVFGEIASRLEQTTDALLKASLVLRDHTLEEVLAR